MKVVNNYSSAEIEYLKNRYELFFRTDRWQQFKMEVYKALNEKTEENKKPSLKEIAINRLYTIKH